MALSEPERGPFEGKFGLEQEQMDFGTHEHGVQNNHHLKDPSLNPSTSLNTSAHDTNARLAAHDYAPSLTNGVDRADIHLNDTQTSLEPNSSLPDSAETGDSRALSSSQSAPDDIADHSSIKLDPTSVEPSPALVQQPTSELREETQPVSQEKTAEIKEQKKLQDLVSDPELSNELTSGASDLNSGTQEIQAQTESTAPIASQVSHADSTMSPGPVVAPSLEDRASTPQPSKESDSIPTTDIPHHPPVPVPEGASTEAPIDPAPSPTLPAETSPVVKTEIQTKDQVMQDAPSSPAKVAREREDDDLEDGPAAKRSKTEDATTDFKVPERPAINTQVNGTSTEAPLVSTPPMTQLQYKHCMRTIQNVKRIMSSTAFRQPVDFVALNIPSYPNVITKPMDLRTLEENLKENKYPTVDAFTADFNQIVQNCETFNGRESTFTKSAYDMKASFDKNMSKIPGPDVTEPSPADRKKKAIIPSAAKVTPARRESRSSLPGSARSPVSAGSPQTFALNPQGVPLIRRDSTFGDGRPKREIHPPAPRDLPYANQKPKKKKYQWELKFCEKVLGELSKPKYHHLSWPFMSPVDPVALNIPTYHSIIKKPMDFGTMKTKLDHGEYENAKEFEADARQVFQNCYRFNPPSDPINNTGHQFEALFDSEWNKKRDWIEANTPSSGPQSAGSSEAEDSDEEDEEEDEEEEEQPQTQLLKLQQQIAAMSRQVELISQKKKSPPVTSKKASKGGAKPVRKDTKKTAAPAKAEKKAASKPAKKEKTPYVTYEQKQDISNRINSLSETKMATALRIIRDNMPNLQQGVQDDELELDIDELSDEVLHKLLVFVRKHAPHADDAPARPAPTASSAAPARKKNKPMSKTEQEARIAQVQSGLSAFQKGGQAPNYEEPAAGQESSGEDESSESEEE